MNSRGVVALPIVVTLLALAVGTALWWRGDLNALICDGDCGPDYASAPAALATEVVPARPEAGPGPASIDGAALLAAVQSRLDAEALGEHVGFVALDPADGSVLARRDSSEPFIPASTTKLLTAFAALSTIDPSRRFSTSVVGDGDRITLVGGGDPYLTVDKPKKKKEQLLAPADLATLATATATDLKARGQTSVSLAFNDGLFVGPPESSAWESSYVRSNIVTRISALWVDRGVVSGSRKADPAAFAASEFSRLLVARGIEVDGEPQRAAASGAPIASVSSATTEQILENLLVTSDNEAAEVMLRHVAMAGDQPASFEGGVAAVRTALETAGVSTTGLELHDGSGLSRDNRISPDTLVDLIVQAQRQPRTSAMLGDLPMAGWSGSLRHRFAASDSGIGLVRAKTGTLTGVHSVAGVVTLTGGRTVVFALMVDRTGQTNPFATQKALDAVVAAMADCSCQISDA